MKIYVASGLENAPVVKRLVAALEGGGHTITFKWFESGPAFHPTDTIENNIARMGATAALEIAGVLEAAACVVLLPGGRGTHVEMGIALGMRAITCTVTKGEVNPWPKPVRTIVAGTNENWPSRGVDSHQYHGNPCAFHYAPGVERLNAETEGELFALILTTLGKGA